MSREIFKDIKGYEGIYQISNRGSVFSINAKRMMKLNKHKCGYMKIQLAQNGIYRTFLVHRLVASNFLDNVNNYPDVNHIDGDKTNNNVENLEWCTKSHNTLHAYENNISKFRDNVLSNLAKINQEASYCRVILKKGSELFEFSSVSKAAEFFNLKRDNITRAIRNGHKVGGFEVWGWKKANEESL